MPLRRSALAVQAAYYIATGLWPLFSMRTFEAMTGPKVDRWLVKMVGALAAVTGTTLAVGLAGEELSPETVTLATTSALAFAAIDTVYALRRRISAIYLADALVEIALVAAVVRGSRGGPVSKYTAPAASTAPTQGPSA